MKYNDFDLEHTLKYDNSKYHSGRFTYQSLTDQYICPEGKSLFYKETQSITTDNGYLTERRIYQAAECSNCPKRQLCCKGNNNRTIQISGKLRDYRKRAKENLESEKGIVLRSQRSVDVESVFGQIKHNKQFRRFYTRGLKNVNTEWAIISIAHNIKKMAN